ncbi:MAG: glycosyltransferase family 2 protein [archaeon]|nr:glycosyltransferase family 2 protein [archaeon]
MFDFKFSIIIAAYNSQEYIKKAIDSIVSQSIGFKDNVEIIIVNDGSYDNTIEIVNEYIEKYPNNIRLINNSTNLGVSASRNLGINESKGEFISFLDSDDYISNKTLDTVLKTFNNNLDIDLIAIPIYLFGLQKGEHLLNYKFKEFSYLDDENKKTNDSNVSIKEFSYLDDENKKTNENNVSIVNLKNYP